MKKIFLSIILMLCMVQINYAGQLSQNSYGQNRFIKDDFTYATSEWVVYDIDTDGKGEYLYFDSNGIMILNSTTPDGYTVDNQGRWVIDGIIQKVDLNISIPEIETNVIDNGATSIYDTSGADIFLKNKTNEFVDNGDNTEGVENDPNILPPKVKEAIKWIRNYCNEDGIVIIPHSKKYIKYKLKIKGYKRDIIDRAIDDCNVDWKNHALILAKACKNLNLNNNDIKKILNASGFKQNGEIDYAMENIVSAAPANYLVPSDYTNLTREEAVLKLKTELGIPDNQIEQALVFIDDFKENIQ